MPRKYKRKVDRRMHDYGEIDFNKKVIRVNPRLRGLLNTIIHEELHRQFPDKSEKWIVKRANKEESEITIPDAMKLLDRYKKG